MKKYERIFRRNEGNGYRLRFAEHRDRALRGCHVIARYFLQAEDGIRDIGVTGVQTCALSDLERAQDRGRRSHALRTQAARRTTRGGGRSRSEERRVGKECRSRWWPDHYKRKLGGAPNNWTSSCCGAWKRPGRIQTLGE